MKRYILFSHRFFSLPILFFLSGSSITFSVFSTTTPVSIYLIGDSTMADYSDDYTPGKTYEEAWYPLTGWGQVFQECFVGADLLEFSNLFEADSVLIKNRARGGSSTRSFFQTGRWRGVHKELKEGDFLFIQFGHNDSSRDMTDRNVTIEGYKEFLRLFVSQAREKGATPILFTSVTRNYPWNDGHLQNGHKNYSKAVLEIKEEMNVLFIDLNQLSLDAFSEKGQEYVNNHYYLNLPADKYQAYPEGKYDNTHFQPEGAKAVAKLVFEALKTLNTDEGRP